jgi:hypothetical protein
MSALLKAVAVDGTIDEHRQLHLDDPLPVNGPSRVRVIILIPEEQGEIKEDEWLRAAAASPAFAFLNDPEEDIYTLADGRPFSDPG